MSNVNEHLIDIMARFTAFSSKQLPDDVVKRLEEMRLQEDSPMARLFYDAMFDDLDKAKLLDRPCCQDTGVLQYFVRAGEHFPYIGQIEGSLRAAAKLATSIAPLRPNVVEMFDEKNTGDNTGTKLPWIDWEIVPESDSADIWVYMAGGGCSLPGTAKVLMPLEGYEGAVKFVFDQITSYGVNACPPLLIGIGLGGSVDVAAKLSKKALLRTIGSENVNERGAGLERMMLEGLNDIGIGPGGIGGKSSVMAVHIEHAGRHPATLAVGLSTGCWAHRRGLIHLESSLEYELPLHLGAKI